jgi:hypothetical protein
MLEDRSVQELLALRRLTRAISETLKSQLKEYLAALAPLFRPKSVLGDYVQGGPKEMVKGADAAFKELQGLYEALAAQSKVFSVPANLKAPIEVIGSSLEITPMEYPYEAKTGGQTKSITVTCPFKWVLSYGGFAPKPLEAFRSDREEGDSELQRFLIHHLLLGVIVSRQPGLAKILDSLHFPTGSGPLEGFGDLPATHISSCISTVRPPDAVIIESTEVSGTAAFEEVVNVDDIDQIRDPLKERLIDLVKSEGANVLV